MRARSQAELWSELGSYSDTYTCYSAALASWAAYGDADWASVIDSGLWLTVQQRPGGLFAFGHFPPGLRSHVNVTRTGSAGRARALEGVLAELDRSGRVIVAGDGFHLPWHVACGRRHVPHWFVVAGSAQGPTIVDPFSARNELGVQEGHRSAVTESELAALLEGLPGDDQVLALREALALGAETAPPPGAPYQWFVAGSAAAGDATSVAREADGARAGGADAVSLLASHLREHGQDPWAYRQADDLWSIARHRAFHCRHAADAGDRALKAWAAEHGPQLVRKWSHIAPLMMQATLALGAGREASGSVPATLDQLAELERAAAGAHPSPYRTVTDEGGAALPSAGDRRHERRRSGGA